MNVGMFIVKFESNYYGPYLEDQAEAFAKRRGGAATVQRLVVPVARGENATGELTVSIVEDTEHAAKNDAIKAESLVLIAAFLQDVFFVRRADRVFTVEEMAMHAKQLGLVHSAVESLMRHAEAVVADPSEKNVEGLRKALWRNRGSSDFDPHYAQRNW